MKFKAQHVSFQSMLDKNTTVRAKEAAKRSKRLANREATAREEKQKRVVSATAESTGAEKNKLKTLMNKLCDQNCVVHRRGQNIQLS